MGHHERVVPAVFAVLAITIAVAMVVGITSISTGSDAPRAQGPERQLPVYWTVRKGDSYVEIAARTGLSIEQLQTFNPRVDPSRLLPGQRVKLRLRVPPPPPKPKGPRFWTVRSGQTLGAIAEKTGHSVSALMDRNPKLKPTTLQPGDRIRLRR